MNNIRFLVLLGALAILIAGCGTLEVGIETTPTVAPRIPSTPSVTAVPTINPTDTVAATLTRQAILPSPTQPKPTATTTPAPDRITFPVGGNTFAFTARLEKGVPQRYILRILAQQKMTITSGINVTITVLDDAGSVLQSGVSSPGQWQGTIPATGDYVIVLAGQGLVTVTIEIPPPGS